MAVASFFASPLGRMLRAGVGVLLILAGILVLPYWLAFFGVLFVLAAALNVCTLAPFFGGPFRADRLPPESWRRR
jgi:hypothetical protein